MHWKGVEIYHVFTNHHTLQGFMKQPRLNRRQARWCYYITPSDFIVYYRTRITNPDVRVNCLYQVLGSARVYWRVQLNTIGLSPGTHCKYSGIECTTRIKLTASIQESISLRVCRNLCTVSTGCTVQEWSTKVALRVKTKYMHCKYGLYCAGMVNKGSPQGEDQEADHLHIGSRL